MRRSVSACGWALVVLGLQVGCAGHSVRYQPFIKQQIPPTEHAVAISGSSDEARPYFEKAQLAHNTPRQTYELMLEGLERLTGQLGSPDYVLIGEVFGGGNAWANQQTLAEALCEKAARKGGDVVMILSQATVEQPFVYTTPGYSTTNASATAYGYGNYATAYGTSQTTYTPSRTYAGVMYKPQANGLVFKHVPGLGADRKRLLQADDESLAKAMAALQALGNDTRLSWQVARRRWRQIVQEATEQSARDRDQDIVRSQ